MNESELRCPSCGSNRVTVTEETMLMVNTLEHWCHSVKAHDSDAKAGGWLPIETAPKDGRCLVWRKHSTRPLIARYCKDFEWFEDEGGVHLYHLTHWQPLPTPPKDPA